MKKTLEVSPELALPLDWTLLATVVFGTRGTGKTTFGSIVAEEANAAGLRFAAIDLKGDWWGLKSTADGTGEGLPVVVVGGDHADLPLEADAGRSLADLVAESPHSFILDLEHLSKGKQVRFLATFFERLYDVNRAPLLLLLDEAQRYAPQLGGRGQDPNIAICLGAVEDLVKLGRKHGIGVVVFTQRGAGLNKEVSELCDVLLAFRTPGPLDQDRVKKWLEANATKEQADVVLGSIAKLRTGTAIVASGHPDLDLLATVTFRRRWTFDSSATPRIGERVAEPKVLAKPDLEALRGALSEAIERAEADDPARLRQRIKDLEAILAENDDVFSKAKAGWERERGAILEEFDATVADLRARAWPKEHVEAFQARVEEFSKDAKGLVALGDGLYDTLLAIASLGAPKDLGIGQVDGLPNSYRSAADVEALDADDEPIVPAAAPSERVNVTTILRETSRVRPLRRGDRAPDDDATLRKGARTLLEAAVAHHPLRLTRSQLAALSRYSPKSSTFDGYYADLRRAGFLDGPSTDLVVTAAGLEFAGYVERKPKTEAELIDGWRSILKKGARTLFDVLVDAKARREGPISRDELARRGGYSPTSSTFDGYVSTLRKNGLMGSRAGGLVLSDELTLERKEG